MPRYIYQCHKCGELYEVRHAFNDDFTICSQLNPDCDKLSSIERVPQAINYLSEATPISHKVGQLVNEYIGDTKEEVKKYKKELKNWKPKQ